MNSRIESFLSKSANLSLPILEDFILEGDLAENLFDSISSSELDSTYGRELSESILPESDINISSHENDELHDLNINDREEPREDGMAEDGMYFSGSLDDGELVPTNDIVPRLLENQSNICAVCAQIWTAIGKRNRRIKRQLIQMGTIDREFNYWEAGIMTMQQDAIVKAGEIYSRRRELLNLQKSEVEFERVAALCGIIIIFLIVFGCF